MNIFHDGYYATHEQVVDALTRFIAEGWTIVAVLPPSGPSSFSIVASHPTETEPSWEK